MTTKARLNLTARFDGEFCNTNCAFYFLNMSYAEHQCHLFGAFEQREPVANGRYKRHSSCIYAAYEAETEEKK